MFRRSNISKSYGETNSILFKWLTCFETKTRRKFWGKNSQKVWWQIVLSNWKIPIFVSLTLKQNFSEITKNLKQKTNVYHPWVFRRSRKSAKCDLSRIFHSFCEVLFTLLLRPISADLKQELRRIFKAFK